MKRQHLIKLALVALAAVAAYYVFAFSVQVMPWPVAMFAAASLVSTYIGLAFADVSHDQRQRAIRIAAAAMIVEAAYGLLYVLSLQSPEWFAPPLPWYLSLVLAALHGGAFSVLAFCVSLIVVHHDTQAHAVDALRQQLDAATTERDAAILDARQWQRIATDMERQLSDAEAPPRQEPRQLSNSATGYDKPALARRHGVSVRTIERWIQSDNPKLKEA